MSSEAADTFTLPWSWRLGSDLMCKLLFKDPVAVNLVVQSLGTDISADNYCVVSNDWEDGTKSDIVYAPKSNSAKLEPPIMIEFQNEVNYDFMSRVIRCSLSAYRRYKVHPIVVIFALKGFSSIEVEEEFAVAQEKPFLKIESKSWAKNCFLVSSNSIVEHVDESPMSPMTAMGYFLTSNAVSLASLKYRSDPTVHLLFHLSKNLIMSELDPKSVLEKSIKPLLENVKRRIEDDVDNDEITEAVAKKIKSYINESFALINEKSGQNANGNKYTKDDILFVESKSEAGKNKNWKAIYDEGRAQGLFKSYSSSHNLKTSFYHIKRRSQK